MFFPPFGEFRYVELVESVEADRARDLGKLPRDDLGMAAFRARLGVGRACFRDRPEARAFFASTF